MAVKNLQQEFPLYRQPLFLISPNTLLQLLMSRMLFFPPFFFFKPCFENLESLFKRLIKINQQGKESIIFWMFCQTGQLQREQPRWTLWAAALRTGMPIRSLSDMTESALAFHYASPSDMYSLLSSSDDHVVEFLLTPPRTPAAMWTNTETRSIIQCAVNQWQP